MPVHKAKTLKDFQYVGSRHEQTGDLTLAKNADATLAILKKLKH